MKQQIKPQWMAVGLATALILSTGLAFAERTDVTVTAPGVELHQKRGWFGTGKTEYKDALGNSYSNHNGLFGWHRTQGSVLGTSVRGHGNNVTVTGPSGDTLVKHSHHWWSGDKTVINGNGMVNEAHGLFHRNPQNPQSP